MELNERTLFEHFITGESDNFNTITEQLSDDLIQDLFKTPPIKFIPRKNNVIDYEVDKMIQ